MNIIIITGASSGIGQEFARQLDTLFPGMDEFWLIARRKERMEALSRELSAKCRIIGMDLTDLVDLGRFSELLEIEKPRIRILVNSAGFGLMGETQRLSLPEQKAMIDLNCTALTEMTCRCLPYMQKNSRIIQMASSAAFLPQENFAVYAATKSYVLSFSQALRQELKHRVDTEFFERAEQYGKTLAVKKLTIVPADRVVKKAIRDSYDKKALSVYSLPIQAFHVLCKLLPHDVIFGIMRRLKS